MKCPCCDQEFKCPNCGSNEYLEMDWGLATELHCLECCFARTIHRPSDHVKIGLGKVQNVA